MKESTNTLGYVEMIRTAMTRLPPTGLPPCCAYTVHQGGAVADQSLHHLGQLLGQHLEGLGHVEDLVALGHVLQIAQLLRAICRPQWASCSLFHMELALLLFCNPAVLQLLPPATPPDELFA